TAPPGARLGPVARRPGSRSGPAHGPRRSPRRGAVVVVVGLRPGDRGDRRRGHPQRSLRPGPPRIQRSVVGDLRCGGAVLPWAPVRLVRRVAGATGSLNRLPLAGASDWPELVVPGT